MSDPRPTRDGVERAARDVRVVAEKNGQPITQAQAESRVREAVREGDRKRDNNHR